MAGSRSDQLAEIAYRIGIDFSPEDDWGLINLLEDFKLFRRGFGKRISNVFRSRDEMLETDLRVFDYQYTISTGNNSKRFRQTVFFADSRKLGLPEFRMKPELFIHKIGALLGFKDINFESFPEFSRQYYLKSSDEQYLRASLHNGILRFFSVEKGWRVEGLNYYLIFYKKDVLLPPQEIRDFHKKGTQVFELFKGGSDLV